MDMLDRDDAASRRIAEILQRRVSKLIDLWEGLGASGPIQSFPASAVTEQYRRRYLVPLARVLIGGLSGSADHAAVYLDERLRYIDPTYDADQRRAVLKKSMQVEFSALAEMLGDAIAAPVVEQRLWEFHRPLVEPEDPCLRLLLIGDCVFVETRAFLAPKARAGGKPVEIRHVFFSAGQPVENVDSAVIEEVKRFKPNLIGLSLFTFEGVPPYSAAWRQAGRPLTGRRATSYVAGLVELVRQVVADIRSVSNCTIAVHAPAGLPLDRLRRRVAVLPAHSRWQKRLVSELSKSLTEFEAGTENTLLVDETALLKGKLSVRKASGPAFPVSDVPSGYFHTTRLGPLLADHYWSLVQDYDLLGRAKVLLVDFDNTLWRGVMAEGEVIHHVERQKLLLQLRKAGVLLVALSKNEASSIRWSEMVLGESDFVLTKINWQPKPDSVMAAIKELDLAPDAFVLLDDNPVERALVTEQVPGVRALDPEPRETWQALRRWLDFPSTAQTEEARRRTQMYREATERRAVLSGVHDYADMMRSLDLRHAVRPAVDRDMPRLLELIQRTNQFNTTTRRRSTAEVRALLTDSNFGIYVASLRDRFGDLGTVAVAIFDRPRQLFDSVIMSCRAMGFALEIALIREVLDAEGAASAAGLFYASARNAPAADLFSRAGFVRRSEELWVLEAGMAKPEIPPWFAAAPRTPAAA